MAAPRTNLAFSSSSSAGRRASAWPTSERAPSPINSTILSNPMEGILLSEGWFGPACLESSESNKVPSRRTRGDLGLSLSHPETLTDFRLDKPANGARLRTVLEERSTVARHSNDSTPTRESGTSLEGPVQVIKLRFSRLVNTSNRAGVESVISSAFMVLTEGIFCAESLCAKPIIPDCCLRRISIRSGKASIPSKELSCWLFSSSMTLNLFHLPLKNGKLLRPVFLINNFDLS